jgi:hypothetical protein
MVLSTSSLVYFINDFKGLRHAWPFFIAPIIHHTTDNRLYVDLSIVLPYQFMPDADLGWGSAPMPVSPAEHAEE